MYSGRERRAALPRRVTRPLNPATLVVICVAGLGALNFEYPAHARAPFARFLNGEIPEVRPSANAYGESGEVKVRFALPGDALEYPLDVQGDPGSLQYSWTRHGDTTLAAARLPLSGAQLRTPTRPGFYRLVILRGDNRRDVDELAVAVLMPFEKKVRGVLNGYRIGTYRSEPAGGKLPTEGFLEILPSDLNLPITRHLRVADFLTHDRQVVWPRYAAVSPRLLDKIELVVTELERWHGADSLALELDVRSGYRSPEHNRRVRRAARDSRHQYGDAADLAIDANNDGKFTEVDGRLVGLAVEIVEMRYPELAGGLGLYLRGRRPYVHIDARGKKARWRG